MIFASIFLSAAVHIVKNYLASSLNIKIPLILGNVNAPTGSLFRFND